MIFKLHDERELKKKFAWLPVCIDEEKRIYVWLESYTEKVLRRYGINGVTYQRETKNHTGTATGWAG